MTPIIFQLVIILTVAIAYFIRPKFGLYTAIFWTAWTLFLLFLPLLIFTQLLFAWGTYFGCRHFSRSHNKISELERALSGYSKDFKAKVVGSVEQANIAKIQGAEHFNYLIEAIKKSSKEIIILSGWINSGVVDGHFIQLLSEKLENGVRLYIGYGWENFSGQHQTDEYSQNAILGLRDLAHKFPDRFTFRKFPNHQKVLITDRTFIACGSNNWLSNRKFRNEEMSFAIHLPKIAQDEAEKIVSYF